VIGTLDKVSMLTILSVCACGAGGTSGKRAPGAAKPLATIEYQDEYGAVCEERLRRLGVPRKEALERESKSIAHDHATSTWTPGDASSPDGPSKDAIEQVIVAHRREVQACVDGATALYPDARGRIAVKFIIASTGLVAMSALASVAADGSSLPRVATQLSCCIREALMTWQFPVRTSPGITVVTYPWKIVTTNR
jgi:hypothetical protein